MLGANAGVMTDALHLGRDLPRDRRAAAARVRRADRARPDFTIHDREDSADLMNLVRHELGFSQTESRFPTKGTCLAIYSRAVNAETPLDDGAAGRISRGAPRWEAQLRELFAAYVEAKQAQNVLDYDDLLLYWAQMMARARARGAISATRFDHVLVDEYQDTNRLQAAILLALKPDGARPHRGRRRRAVDLLVPGRDGAQHPRLPAAVHAAGRRSSRSSATTARPQPILDAANAVIGLAARALHQEPVDRARSRRSGRGWSPCATRPTRRATSSSACWRTARRGTALKQQAVLFRTSHHSGPLEIELTRRNIPFVKFGGLKFLEAAHVKDVLAVLRFAENPRDRVAGFRVAAAAARRRAGHRAQRVLDAMADAGRSRCARCRASPRRRARGEDWTGFVDALSAAARRQRRLAGRDRARARAGTSRISSACTRTRRRARPISLQLEQIAAGYPSRERFLTELTLDPPDATSDEAGRAAARRGLPDPVDHPFGQGPGVEVGVRAQRRRRLHPVRPRHRHDGARSRRSGGCSTSR